jgi:hypothetical protein
VQNRGRRGRDRMVVGFYNLGVSGQGYGVYRHFQQCYIYIVPISFIGQSNMHPQVLEDRTAPPSFSQRCKNKIASYPSSIIFSLIIREYDIISPH